MKPKTQNQYPINNLIAKRWSPRAFTNKQISNDDINSLFEAARWAASSRNSQPWRFIFSTKENTEVYDKLFSCMVEWNQSWAKTAPLLVLGVAKLNTGEKDHINTHALYDLGLSVGNLTTQATSMGIYLHQMSGILPEKATELFNLSDSDSPVVMLAIGYPGDVSNIPTDIASGEFNTQERLEIKDFAFNGGIVNP